MCQSPGGRERVEVKDGEFRIVFTRQVDNPALKGIKLIPQAEAGAGPAASAAAIRVKAGSSAPFTNSIGQVWQPDTGFEGGMMSQVGGAFGGGPGNRAGGPGGFARGPGGRRGGPGGFGGPGGGSG